MIKIKFDVENDIAVLCVQDYKNIHAQGETIFKKDKIYSVAFARSVGCELNTYTMRCTLKKHYFKCIEKSDIEAPEPQSEQVEQSEQVSQKPAKSKKSVQVPEPSPEIV
jgi:hypothetical protein